jgi:hypothetical protein
MSTYFNISDKVAVKKAPENYTVAFAGDFINVVDTTFTISNGLAQVQYYYTATDSVGNSITGNGSFGGTNSVTVDLDTTALVDGLVTLSVYLINPALGVVTDTATRRAVTGAYVSALQGRMAIFEAEDCAFAALTALQNTSIE